MEGSYADVGGCNFVNAVICSDEADMVFFRSDRRVGGFVHSEGITSCFVRALGRLRGFFRLFTLVRVGFKVRVAQETNIQLLDEVGKVSLKNQTSNVDSG